MSDVCVYAVRADGWIHVLACREKPCFPKGIILDPFSFVLLVMCSYVPSINFYQLIGGQELMSRLQLALAQAQGTVKGVGPLEKKKKIVTVAPRR